MTTPEAHPQRLRVAHLNPRAPTPFTLRPDKETCAAIAEELGIDRLTRLEFSGRVEAEGSDGWMLKGGLTARVVQPCVITLKPVETALKTQVERHYTPHFTAPEGEEVEMPDDALEPLSQFIDLTEVMIEELTLALPEYPRARGAELPGEPEESPETESRRPFAGLDKLLKGEGKQE